MCPTSIESEQLEANRCINKRKDINKVNKKSLEYSERGFVYSRFGTYRLFYEATSGLFIGIDGPASLVNAHYYSYSFSVLWGKISNRKDN